jgi:uncharacterized protein (TIGR03435 family)
MFMGSSGGPGSRDPGLFKCTNCSLSMLVSMAYDLKRYQLTAPGWMETERFDITAKIPEGATKEQFRLMQQNLLTERFKLAVHHEKKELPMYELVVAKNGPKFKESEEEAAPPDGGPPPGPPGPPTIGKDGFPVFPAGGRGGMIMMNGKARMQARKESMEQFTNMLSNQVNRPVTDATGLKGKYDFTLDFTADMVMMRGPGGAGIPPPPPGGGTTGGGGAGAPVSIGSEADSGPTIFSAIQSQLGLKLESKKGTVDILVVDHIEKVPTEN